MAEYRVGICPECKVWESDVSSKPLYQCEYCKRWFCERHVEPRMAFIVNFKARIKPRTWEDRAWEVFLAEEETKRGQSHPDFVYTQQRWKEIRLEKRMEWQRIIAFIERQIKYQIPKDYQLWEEKEVMEGYCPKCGSDQIRTTAYRQEGTYYECLNCGHKLLVKPEKLLVKPEKPTIEEEELMEDYCPKCGSERIQTSAYKPEGIHYECLDCGHKFLASELPVVRRKQYKAKTAYVIASIVIATCVIVILVLILSESFPFY